MHSFFVTIYRRVFRIQSTHDDASVTKTDGIESTRGDANHASKTGEGGLSRVDSGYWQNETGNSTVAYHEEPDMNDTNEQVKRKGDGDEVMREQRVGIMKRMEVRVSEYRM